MEQDRIRLLELLAGIVDWKRFLGLLMWCKLPPDSDLTFIFREYQHLLDNEKAPVPVPVYINEGFVEDGIRRIRGKRFDLPYYLMLLYGSEKSESSILKPIFSVFASTYDAFDHHMIWHQRAVLEAIDTFSYDDLHVLDMGYVSQLLSLGLCHWVIYVVLHMSHRDDYPYRQANVIREILFQYCETWSAQDIQRQFIVDLGIPSAWLHKALAVYHAYFGNYFNAVEHYLGCASWQKAHSTFVASVAHSLFLSGKRSEIQRLAKSMEDHKLDITNWDFGAGIYLSFLSLRSVLKREDGTMTKLVSLKDKYEDCKKFFGCLEVSLEIWNNRLPIDARTLYAIMVKEISDLLVGVCNYGRGDQ